MQTIFNCILTGFMKQMQCNVLNIKTAAKQVWLYFIRRTTRPGYAATTTNLQMVLNTPKSLYLNQATKKKYLPNFPTQKLPESKMSNPQKSFYHPRHLKSRVPPMDCTTKPWNLLDCVPKSLLFIIINDKIPLFYPSSFYLQSLSLPKIIICK